MVILFSKYKYFLLIKLEVKFLTRVCFENMFTENVLQI